MTTFLPTYHERNMKNIAQLGDKTKEMVLKVYDEAIKAKLNVLIYSTIRTEKEQKENVKKGVSKIMKSYHLVGQAFDVVLCDGKDDKWDWYGKPDFKKFVTLAKKHGFTWGGDWNNDGSSRDETFVDSPHFQYSTKLTYGADTFKTKGKAELPKQKESVKPKPKVAYHNHTIMLGQSLSLIAKKHGVSVGEILEINPQIKNKNVIYAGHSLKIPNK